MKIFAFLSAFLFTASSFSQQWVEMMQNPNANFYDIQKEFNNYWSQPDKKEALDKMKFARRNNIQLTSEEKSKTAGWKQFKRWEWRMEPRVYPSGNLLPPNDYFEAVNEKIQETTMAGNWTFLGPGNIPANGGGAGRLNCVRFDPSDTNIVYAGSPAGGLWKSTNGGNGWTMWNTDALGSLGVSDVAVDPTNSQIIYLGNGDADNDNTYGLGVLKSTDGGVTWNTTGLNWTVTQGRTVRKILIDPGNTQIIHAAVSNGIYRSTNGGTTFTQVSTTGPDDMEFKPGDPTTIYASAYGTIYRSTNSGQSYVYIYNVSGSGRLVLAVTPANANYIYVLSADGFGSYGAFNGLYRSTDGGASFSQRSNTPNILGYSYTGSDGSGQGWYDLAVAASPTNADEVVVGGVNIWRSTNGGTSWSIIAYWAGSGTLYVHADIHDLIYLNGTTIYAGCDGGIFRTQNSGGSWSDLSNDLHISQAYRLGQSANNGTLLLTGRQDNGTDRLNGTTWSNVLNGDGMECFIDRANNNTMFGEVYYGDFYRSTNGGGSWSGITTGLSGSGAWVTPWVQDPVNAGTLWAGYSQVFKSTNQGTSWTQSGTITGSGTIHAIDVAPSNNQVIYASRTTSIIKSTNGGTSWSAVTGNLPVSSASITYIEIDPADPTHVWVTFSGYSSANKVWVTINGGGSWTNYSTGIPNLPVHCIVYETGSANGTLYAGTDLGVYYRDNTMSSWANYSTGLPNVMVDELEIQYTVGKLRAATYGRGMWESPLANPVGVSEPVACEEDCIHIFPNPAHDFVTITLNEKENDFCFSIYDVFGREVRKGNLKSKKERLSTNNLPDGIYFLQIQSSCKTYSAKIIVE